MSNRERTPESVERANAETAAVATPEIPGGYPDLTASQLDLIRERSTETVVDPGASLAHAGDVVVRALHRRFDADDDEARGADARLDEHCGHSNAARVPHGTGDPEQKREGEEDRDQLLHDLLVQVYPTKSTQDS